MERNRFEIRSIINRFKGETSYNSVNRTSRYRALTDRESKAIVQKIKQNPKKTSTELQEEFGKNIHPMTVRRVLHGAIYTSRVARRKPLVSLINQKKRLDDAKEFKSKPIRF